MDLSSIEIIFACPFIDVDHLHVHYSSKYNQKEIPVDSPMNELVEKKWMDVFAFEGFLMLDGIGKGKEPTNLESIQISLLFE